MKASPLWPNYPAPVVRKLFSREALKQQRKPFSLYKKYEVLKSVISDVRVTWERVSQKLNILTA